MKYDKNIFTYALAGFILLLTFAFFFLVAFVDLEERKEKIIIYILGVLSAIDTQIIAYFYGSSTGSKDKQEMIDKMSSDTP